GRHAGAVRPEVRIEVQLLQAYRALRSDDTAKALKMIEPMLDAPAPANPFHALILHTVAALSLLHAAEFERAREVTRLRYRQEFPQRPEYPRPFLEAVEAVSHVAEGNIRLAIAGLARYLDSAPQASAFGTDTMGLFVSYLLEAAYQASDLERAREYLD